MARAIFECRTPVISAVGHETDVTIADYVADLRAPTPSAAAELAVFDYRQFEEQRRLYEQNLVRSMGRRMERLRYRMEQFRMRLRFHDPKRQIREKRQQLLNAEERLSQVTMQRLQEAKHRLALASGRLHGLSPLAKISGGFGFVTDDSGKRLESIRQVQAGDRIAVRILDGKLTAQVLQKEELSGQTK